MQHPVRGERILERYERLFGFVLCANKENERLLFGKSLIVVHSPHAVVHELALADQIGGAFRYNADKGAPLVMLQGRILFGDLGKLLHELLLFACLFDCLFLCVLPCAQVVSVCKVFGEQVAFQGHINAEVLTGVQVIEIQQVGDVVLLGVVEILFQLPAFEQFADRRRASVPLKLPLAEEEVADFLYRQPRLIRLHDRREVIGVAIWQSEFLSLAGDPFAECLVFGDLFEQRAVLRIRAQTEL